MSGDDGYAKWKNDALIAGGAGMGAAVVMGAAAFAVGSVTGSEARGLVEAILPTSRFLCSAMMTATATILALMLTLLGMSINAEAELRPVFYRRIQQVAFYDMLVLVAATCILVAHCIPITKSDEISSEWYSVTYYCVLVLAALLGGSMVAIVCMLYAAIRDVIHVVGLDDDHRLQRPQGSSEEKGA